jgi:hypothetical protein
MIMAQSGFIMAESLKSQLSYEYMYTYIYIYLIMA